MRLKKTSDTVASQSKSSLSCAEDGPSPRRGSAMVFDERRGVRQHDFDVDVAERVDRAVDAGKLASDLAELYALRKFDRLTSSSIGWSR